MRSLVLLAASLSALAASGCYTPLYSTGTVTPTETATLATSHRDELALRTTDGGVVRIGPESWVRVRRKDGTYVTAHQARDFEVDAEGFSVDARLFPLDERFARARVSGLAERTKQWLRAHASGCEDDGGDPCVGVPEDRPDPWAPFVERVSAQARAFGEPTGAWSFAAPYGAGWTTPLSGDRLHAAIARGVRIGDGARWSEVDVVDVGYVNGAKTFGASVAMTTAAFAANLLLLGLAAGSSVRMGEAGPTFKGSAVPSVPTSAPETDKPLQGTPVNLTDEALRVVPDTVEPLLSKQVRRRSTIEPTVSLKGGADLARARLLESRATALVRLGEVVELGGGVRALDVRSADLRAGDLGGFGYVGSFFDLDARRRFEIALGLDLGATHDVGFVSSVDLGLRVRPARSMLVGAYPFNPTLTATPLAPGRYFAFPSRLEVAWLF
jgi:hypothetical protein